MPRVAQTDKGDLPLTCLYYSFFYSLQTPWQRHVMLRDFYREDYDDKLLVCFLVTAVSKKNCLFVPNQVPFLFLESGLRPKVFTAQFLRCNFYTVLKL